MVNMMSVFVNGMTESALSECLKEKLFLNNFNLEAMGKGYFVNLPEANLVDLVKVTKKGSIIPVVNEKFTILMSYKHITAPDFWVAKAWFVALFANTKFNVMSVHIKQMGFQTNMYVNLCVQTPVPFDIRSIYRNAKNMIEAENCPWGHHYDIRHKLNWVAPVKEESEFKMVGKEFPSYPGLQIVKGPDCELIWDEIDFTKEMQIPEKPVEQEAPMLSCVNDSDIIVVKKYCSSVFVDVYQEQLHEYLVNIREYVVSSIVSNDFDIDRLRKESVDSIFGRGVDFSEDKYEEYIYNCIVDIIFDLTKAINWQEEDGFLVKSSVNSLMNRIFVCLDDIIKGLDDLPGDKLMPGSIYKMVERSEEMIKTDINDIFDSLSEDYSSLKDEEQVESEDDEEPEEDYDDYDAYDDEYGLDE